MNIYKNLLQDFWSEVSSGRTKRKTLVKYVTEEHKINTLIMYSKYYHGTGSELKKAREDFDKIKYSVRGIRLTEQSVCFVCFNRAECRHHIIMLKNSGQNMRQNIVHLCNSCHCKIHPWL